MENEINKQSERWKNKYNNVDDSKIFEVRPKFPKCINIEISDICNYDCLFCASSKFFKEKGLIDDKLALRLIDEAYDNGAREICFHINGEPLTNPNFEKYVESAKEKGYTYIFMTTNGFLADINRMKKVVDAGIDSVRFSINSGRNKYKVIHGSGNYDIVINNLKDLIKYRDENKKKFMIGISMVETKYTKNDCIILKKEFENIVDDITILKVNDDAGQCSLNRELMSETSEGLASVKSIPCPIPFNSCYVTRIGHLTMCCGDKRNYMAVADLNDVRISKAWNNEAATRLRKKMISGEIEGIICYNCIFGKSEEVYPLNESYAKKYISKEYDDDRVNRIQILKELSYLED